MTNDRCYKWDRRIRRTRKWDRSGSSTITRTTLHLAQIAASTKFRPDPSPEGEAITMSWRVSLSYLAYFGVVLLYIEHQWASKRPWLTYDSVRTSGQTIESTCRSIRLDASHCEGVRRDGSWNRGFSSTSHRQSLFEIIRILLVIEIWCTELKMGFHCFYIWFGAITAGGRNAWLVSDDPSLVTYSSISDVQASLQRRSIAAKVNVWQQASKPVFLFPEEAKVFRM